MSLLVIVGLIWFLLAYIGFQWCQWAFLAPPTVAAPRCPLLDAGTFGTAQPSRGVRRRAWDGYRFRYFANTHQSAENGWHDTTWVPRWNPNRANLFAKTWRMEQNWGALGAVQEVLRDLGVFLGDF